MAMHVAILVWLGSVCFKTTAGIGYPPMKPPISNHSEGENITEYTVHPNETLRVVIRRVSKQFEQILYKGTNRIVGLDSKNKMIYVNDSGSPNLSLEKIQKLYYMKILNDTHVEVVINCGTNFVEGNYTVKYNGVSLLEEPHPSRFTVKFAESLPSTARPYSARFFTITSSQIVASSTQSTYGGQGNLSTPQPHSTTLSTSAKFNESTDKLKPFMSAVGIGIGCAVLVALLRLALLLVPLVCKYKYIPYKRRAKSFSI